MTQLKWMEFRGAQIACRVTENEGKDTIVMLHPAFADHESFTEQEEAFKAHYQVIVLDMPGHGQSRVKGTSVTLRDMPEILRTLLDEHRILSAHLLGVSLGSLAAQRFAALHPERVRSVTIVGGYSIHKGYEPVVKAQRKEGLKWLFYMFSMNRFREYVSGVSCWTESARQRFKHMSCRFTRGSFAAMAGANDMFSPQEAPVSYPLQIIAGQHDLPIILDASRRLHEAEPHSRLLLLPDAGHCANMDAPVAFNKAVLDFLSTSC